jgi:hypothetical protein
MFDMNLCGVSTAKNWAHLCCLRRVDMGRQTIREEHVGLGKLGNRGGRETESDGEDGGAEREHVCCFWRADSEAEEAGEAAEEVRSRLWCVLYPFLCCVTTYNP